MTEFRDLQDYDTAIREERNAEVAATLIGTAAISLAAWELGGEIIDYVVTNGNNPVSIVGAIAATGAGIVGAAFFEGRKGLRNERSELEEQRAALVYSDKLDRARHDHSRYRRRGYTHDE